MLRLLERDGLGAIIRALQQKRRPTNTRYQHFQQRVVRSVWDALIEKVTPPNANMLDGLLCHDFVQTPYCTL
jgi:hypothetical protein